MITVVVVRHGETAWNREHRMQGWAPTPLTELGRDQARRLGKNLNRRYDIDRIQSSDLHRTRETTELLRDYVDAPVTFDSNWRERDWGVFQGLPANDWFERFPEYALQQAGLEAAYETPDSGESLVEVRKRVLEGWERLLVESEPVETILIVAHGGPIRLILGYLKGFDIPEAILDQPQSNCAINEVNYDTETGETTIVRENDTCHC